MAFAVTYAANGATSGAVPTDATAYAGGATVTVLGNTGTLARTGYTFLGWNTAAAGSGFFRAAAATFAISADTTLYALWTLSSIVTIAEFKGYATKANGDATFEALLQTYLDAAEAEVVRYLGFHPASASYSHTFYGDGKNYITLRAPVITLTSITIDSVAEDTSEWTINRETITNDEGDIFSLGSEAVVVYIGGITSPATTRQEALDWAAIKLAIMRIAALMEMEAGEAIGLTGTSFDGGNSRTFTNYTNYAKYLAPLASLRIARLERLAP
jgi:uncharacterized repeat protein (TIGR02543 family)